MAEGQYKFRIRLDNEHLEQDVLKANKEFAKLVEAAQKAGIKIDESFKNPFEALLKNPPKIPPITGASEAASQLNNLNFATQQIVRELPAATMGINTYFLAISNNIPIFADQIKNLREQGQSAGTIITQIGKSLFSWQTALTAGITLLTVYGKEIGNWIVGLFKGKKALDATKEAQEGLSKAIKENGLGIGDDIVKLRELQNAYKALGDDMNARKQFIIDNKDAFDDLGVSINTVAEADRLLVERTPEFVKAMQLRAQASAAKRIAEEKYEEWLRKRQEYIDERDAGVTYMDEIKAGLENVSTTGAGRPLTTDRDANWYYKQRIGTLKTEAKEVKDVADAYFNLAEAKEVEAQSTLKAAGITETAKDPKTDPKRTKEIGDNLSFFRDADREMERTSELLRERIRQQTADWEDYKIKYGTIQEQLLYTTQKYNRLIAEAQTEGERRSLEAERDAILAEYKEQASEWAQTLVDKTTEQLNTMIEELQAQVEAKQAAFNALDNSDSDDAKKYREEINKLKAQIKVLQQQLGKAKKDIGDDNWADATQVFQNISKAANDAAEGIAEFDEGAASVLRTMAQLAGTAINLIGAIEAVTTASAAAAGTISTMEKASVILAVIGAAIQAVSVLISLFKGSDEVAQTMRQFKELNTELERFRKLSQIDSVEGTIFGEDAYENFSNNLRVMREALDELNETQNKIRDYRLSYWSDTVWGDAYASGAKYDSYVEALANMYVKTRDRSGFAEFFGATDEYAKLGNLYPELFAGGEVSLEGLRQLKESDLWEKISQENRDLIDELIADWERYEEATEAVSDYLKDIFGELGQEVNDALVDAFRNGTDAAEAFGNAASKVIEKLITDMAYAAIIAPIFEDMENRINELNNNRKAMSDAEYMEQLLSIFAEGIGQVSDSQDMFNKALKEGQEIAKELGYDNVFAPDDDSSQRKGIAQASQDSVDELNGRATAIQMHTSSIMAGVQQLTKDSAQALKYLAGIESNTAELRQMRVDMSAMRSDMSALRSDINDIATRGVRMI